MPQFDVHRNRGALKDTIPFVVVVQSALFNDYRRRVVVPLVRRNVVPRSASAGSRLNPVFRVKGMDVVLHPLDMVSVALDQLGENVSSLAEHGQQITDALDELLTSTWS